MDTNQNLQQINTFNGGMNTDVSDALLQKDQYRLANNLRYVTDEEENQGELHFIDGSSIVDNFGDKIILSTQIRNYGIIMYKVTYSAGTKGSTIKDEFGYNVVVGNTYIYVVRVENPYKDLDIDVQHKALPLKPCFCVFGPCLYDEDIFGQKFSTVTRYEDDDNVKLYLANGKTYTLMLNIMEYCGSTVDEISMYPTVQFNAPKFLGLVGGQLKSGLVQYSYSLYKRKGRVSEISPCTKLIPIVNQIQNNPNIGKQKVGLEKDYTSNSGVSLNISIDAKYQKQLDRILIYRIQYTENGQLPTVGVIYDGLYSEGEFKFIDSGQSVLQTLTLEEYNSLSGIHIIPRVIESKNDFLFAANIKEQTSQIDGFDEYDARAFRFDPITKTTHLFDYNTGSIYGTIEEQNGTGLSMKDIEKLDHSDKFKEFDCYNIYNDLSVIWPDYNTIHPDTPTATHGWYDRFTADGKYYGGTGVNISWKFIIYKLLGDASVDEYDTDRGAYGTSYNTTKFSEKYVSEVYDSYYYVKSDGTLENASKLQDSGTERMFDRNSGGRTYANPVVSYALKSLRRDELYRYGIIMYDKYGHSSGVKWIADIRTPSIYTKGFEPFVCKEKLNGVIYDLVIRSLGIEFTVTNLPEECVSYEIVRCNRTDSDIATISQGVVSRPIKKIYNSKFEGLTDSPLTPTGFLTTQRWQTGSNFKSRYGETSTIDDWHEADNWDINDVFQFVSPEICYHKDSTLEQLEKKNLQICPQLYLFGAIGFGGYKHDSDYIDNGDIIDTIHPGITNTSLQLLNGDPVNFTSVGDNPESALKYDPSRVIANNPLNQWSSIQMRARYTDMSFYKSRFAYGYKIFTEILPSSIVLTKGGWYSEAIPSLNPITNFLSNAEDNGNTDIHAHNLWYNSAKRSFSYIKLYNQSNKVLLRGHVKGRPSVDAYYMNGAVRGFPAVEVNSYNKCNVVDYQIASELGWDDLANVSTQDNKTTYNLKYKDSVVSIGGYNFCNWVCGGAYDISGSDLADLKKDNGSAWTNETKSQIMGPGGRCLLLNIDNNWSIDTNYKIDLQSENQMFTDAIGTRSIIRYNQYNDTEEHAIDPINIASPYNDKYYKHQHAVVHEFGQLGWSIVRIIKDSIAGTYLCNLRQTVTPYGGFTRQARVLSSYYSYGNYFKRDTSKCQVFDGDCFIMPFEYVSMHKYYNNKVVNPMTHSVIYSIPVETNINLAYTYGSEFSANCNKAGISNLQIEPSNVYNTYNQKNELYSYNSVYSSQPKSRIFAAYDYLNDQQQDDTIDYRVRYSNEKSNNEIYDSWVKFQAANYLDVDTRYGKITELRTFKNNLVFFQEQAAGLLSVNERTAITDESNMPLILGTGGVLSRYDYLTEKNGMKDSEFVDAVTENCVYWWDHDRKEICAYVGGQNIQILSKEKQVQNFINKQFKLDKLAKTPFVTYDKQFNELIFNITTGDNFEYGSLIYNENTQRFTSLYTMSPMSAISFYNRLYLSYSNVMYEWNINDSKFDGMNRTTLNFDAIPYIKYVVNEQPSFVKVFDNQSFGGRFSGGSDYRLQFMYSTPLKQHSYTDSDVLTDREYDFRLAIPRNNDSEYGDRMRGKTMQCEMVSKDIVKDFSLQYIITKFRMSWS